MPIDGLLELYRGHVVPKEYNAGYVALSYVISFVGAASTLELINRRSWFNGISNHLVLVSSAITMGGIAIWSMHFIGNQALTLGAGEPEMQVDYSIAITVLSFCMPVIFLLAAFYAIGISNRIAWWRVITAGILCGSAICGMHYLGNASIKNYDCIYNTAYIVGAAIIAVVASTVALAMFFILQSLSGSTWWKRTISATVLAGAVSSMHWCASVGTEYRLVRLRRIQENSRRATVIAVICLSLGACIIIAGSAILRARTLKQAARRAQQIELGAIVFDQKGRLLIDSNGAFPSTVVTDFFMSEDKRERFTTSHCQFHWMFQASRNWIGISGLINGMKRHLEQLPHKSRHRDAKKGIQLITDDGKLIEGYGVIFRELFCVAASELSDQLNEPLINAGVLWDEILPKKTASNQAYLQALEKYGGNQVSETVGKGSSDSSNLEKGICPENNIDGQGALMFLVRRLTSDEETQRLVSAGYRFVDPARNNVRFHQQIQSNEFKSKLQDMRNFVDQKTRIKAGVHLAFFAIQDSGINQPKVLVRKEARDLLPSVPLPLSTIEKGHLGLLDRVGGMPVSEVLQRLRTRGAVPRTPEEEQFAKHLSNAIHSLRKLVEEPLFHDSVLTSSMVRLPFGIDGDQSEETVILALRLKISHPVISNTPNCQWVPLNFFKKRQTLAQSRQEFIRVLHDEFDPLKMPSSRANNKLTSGPVSTMRRLRSAVAPAEPKGKKVDITSMRSRAFSKDSGRSSSTVNLCPTDLGDEGPQSPDKVELNPTTERHYSGYQQSFLNGGIVVFQEVTVQVESRKPEPQEDLEPSWSHDTAIEPPYEIDSHQPGLPTAKAIELQPLGWGKHDVSVMSHQLSDIKQTDHDVGTIAAFIDTLLIELYISSI
ncbi:signaling ykow [Fusarium longipes]|uniref:Signaling ykow n=1 Tax=Fusarium longipes TaxID=694270 RepID=A0A395SAK4_9HYPO|nr:signaling ykow [Fusarium longipes]